MERSNIFLTILVSICALLITIVSYADTALLERINVIKNYNSTQFVLDFKSEIEYRAITLRHPDRFVLDLKNVSCDVPVHNLDLVDSQVKKIRNALHQDYYRLVFDLEDSTKVEINRNNEIVGQNKLIITVNKPELVVSPILPTPSIQPQFETPVKIGRADRVVLQKVQPSSIMQPARQTRPPTRDVIVVIDPGHGGKDPGAKGIDGIEEKDVVLAIAKKLQSMINAEHGFKAILTRDDDRYLSLRQRLRLAHKYHADMFVAIHADAYQHDRAHGASVYALSERGATSEAARWLAERENKSEFVGGLDLGDRDYLVRSVLIDLSQTHVISVSLQMGTSILNELGKFADLHHSSVEQAAFVVLKSPDIPSLLVESGFLSNPREASNLTQPLYQNRIALSIKHGIKSFFVTHPPSDTELASLQNQRISV